jgi:hypothetical protein
VVVEPVDEIVVVGGGVGIHFYELHVVVNPVDEIVVVGDTNHYLVDWINYHR